MNVLCVECQRADMSGTGSTRGGSAVMFSNHQVRRRWTISNILVEQPFMVTFYTTVQNATAH